MERNETTVLAEYTRSHRFQAVIQETALKLSHAGLSLHEAQCQALGRLYGMVQLQAAALSYIDVLKDVLLRFSFPSFRYHHHSNFCTLTVAVFQQFQHLIDNSTPTLKSFLTIQLLEPIVGLANVLPLVGVVASRFQTEFQNMARSQALADQSYVSDSSPYVELRQSVPSQIESISPFLDQLTRFITKFRSVDGSEVDIEIAAGEALMNAVVHGNREDPNKRVCVTSRCGEDGEVSITVRDEGEGFDWRAARDPTAPENILSSHGRGIYLIRTLMDEVTFEQNGRVLKMRKGPNKCVNAEIKPERSS